MVKPSLIMRQATLSNIIYTALSALMQLAFPPGDLACIEAIELIENHVRSVEQLSDLSPEMIYQLVKIFQVEEKQILNK